VLDKEQQFHGQCTQRALGLLGGPAQRYARKATHHLPPLLPISAKNSGGQGWRGPDNGLRFKGTMSRLVAMRVDEMSRTAATLKSVNNTCPTGGMCATWMGQHLRAMHHPPLRLLFILLQLGLSACSMNEGNDVTHEASADSSTSDSGAMPPARDLIAFDALQRTCALYVAVRSHAWNGPIAFGRDLDDSMVHWNVCPGGRQVACATVSDPVDGRPSVALSFTPHGAEAE
jgi:hypothetical protein